MYFCKKSVINKFQEIINLGIENISLNKHPKSLYDPLKYVLGLGGKRIGPAHNQIATMSAGVVAGALFLHPDPGRFLWGH